VWVAALQLLWLNIVFVRSMKIKICGLCREADVDYVNDALPDYAGFVFAPSKRRVTVDMAAHLSAALNPNIIPVGVFVNSPLEEVVDICRQKIIGVVQLHGEENGAYISALKNKCAAPVIKAVKIKAGVEINTIETEFANADYFLFDGERAGSGNAFDWSQLEPYKELLSTRAFLAGGINCDNIADAMKWQPFCIDVSSGAESGGVKDRDKILRLVAEARA
jgi:phosphoribosylanthranilate isomerase